MFKLVGELNSADTNEPIADGLVVHDQFEFSVDSFDRQTDEEILDIAVAYYNLAELHSKLGFFKRSASLFNRALALYRRRNPQAMASELWLLLRARSCTGYGM